MYDWLLVESVYESHGNLISCVREDYANYFRLFFIMMGSTNIFTSNPSLCIGCSRYIFIVDENN